MILGVAIQRRNHSFSEPFAQISFRVNWRVASPKVFEPSGAFEKTSGQNITSNLITTQVVPSYLDVNIPFVREYRAAMDRYHPTVPDEVGDRSYKPSRPYSFGSLEGYLNARVFIEILRRAGKDPTRSAFYDAAERMGRFDLGLGAPLEFSPRRHQALDDVWLTRATASGWSPRMVTF